MLLIEQLKTQKFSPTEKEIVQFIINSTEELQEITITELAQITYTNTTSIMRIAKKMGFVGWTDFKKAYLEEWRYLNNYFTAVNDNLPFDEKDDLLTIAKKIAVLEQNTLDDSLSLFEADKLLNVQEILTNADSILVYAEHSNAFIAEVFISRLRRIGYEAKLVHFYHNGDVESYNAKKNSCAIAISYTGENDQLLNCVDILNNKQIPVISITSFGNNSLSKKSSCSLYITTREKLYSKISSYSSSSSIMYILNVLYSIVFSKDYLKNLSHNIELGLEFEHRNTNVGALMEE